MSAPVVSFIIPAFNARRTIDQTLQSVLAQRLTEWEAIIVDDGSRDGTARHCGRWTKRDPRFRLIRQRNAGASAARNTAIRAARGRWLIFLDADDWIADDYLSLMLPLVNDEPHHCLAYCSYVRVSSTGEHLPPDFCPQLAQRPFEFLAERCEPAIHCVLISRELVLEVGGFDPTLATCEDWDLWLRVARRGARFIGCDAPLAFYRMRDGSLSSDNGRVDGDALVVLQRAMCADPRVRTCLPEYLHGKQTETTETFDWRRYLLALAAGQTPPPPQPMYTEADWIEASGDIAFTILGLVAERHQRRISTMAVLDAHEDYEPYANVLERALDVPGLSALILSVVHRMALMEADLCPPRRSGDWLGLELDLNQAQQPDLAVDGASCVLLRLRRGAHVLGYVDAMMTSQPYADCARAVLDGLTLVELLRCRGLLQAPEFWLWLMREARGIGADRVGRWVHRTASPRTLKGLARQALRAGVLGGLHHMWTAPGRPSNGARAQPPGVNDMGHNDQPYFQVPIVVYRIDESARAIAEDDGVSIATVSAHLTYLHRTGYRSISLSELRRCIRERRPVAPRRIVLVLEAAQTAHLLQLQPLLEASALVCVACPAPESDIDAFVAFAEAPAMRRHFEIGLSVSPLDTFPPRRERLQAAMRTLYADGSRTPLACITAIPPHDLLLRQLEALGCEIVVGLGSGITDVENCTSHLPRIHIPPSESLGMFAEKLRCSSWAI